jgi:hypothetical protein
LSNASKIASVLVAGGIERASSVIAAVRVIGMTREG